MATKTSKAVPVPTARRQMPTPAATAPSSATHAAQTPSPADLVEQADKPIINLDTFDLPEDEMLTVVVPSKYTLTREHNKAEVTFMPGVQEMRKSDATHWWSRANGVAVYQG